MKHIFIIILIWAISSTVTQIASAHAIWIESTTIAKKNTAHEVRIFYGDYAEEIIEPTSKWYSDLNALEVWVTSPSKKKTKLILADAKDHFRSTFIPIEDGIYYVTIVHTAKDLGGTTKYEFSSVATVFSGDGNFNFSTFAETLSIIAKQNTFKIGEVIELQVIKGNEPLINASVQVMSPGGWVKTIKTDEKGLLSFRPILNGKYIIETSEHKKQQGEWYGKQYNYTWKGSTFHLLVQ